MADRIYGYDDSARARGSWALLAPAPLSPGFYFDGGIDIEAWSTLTSAAIAAITGERADDLWVVGAQHGASAAPSALPPDADPGTLGQTARAITTTQDRGES